MKMKQTDNVFGRPQKEIFYDGQLNVDYRDALGVVNIPLSKAHWENELYMRGYRVVEETPEVLQVPEENVTVTAEEPKPRAVTGSRRKAKNG